MGFGLEKEGGALKGKGYKPLGMTAKISNDVSSVIDFGGEKKKEKNMGKRRKIREEK